jgi:hypothetical protein
MTTGTLTRTAGVTRTAGGGSARRIASLARGEALLLRRNPIALLTALATPVAMVLATRASVPDNAGGLGGGAPVVTSLTAFTLLFVRLLQPRDRAGGPARGAGAQAAAHRGDQ